MRGKDISRRKRSYLEKGFRGRGVKGARLYGRKLGGTVTPGKKTKPEGAYGDLRGKRGEHKKEKGGQLKKLCGLQSLGTMIRPVNTTNFKDNLQKETGYIPSIH